MTQHERIGFWREERLEAGDASSATILLLSIVRDLARASGFTEYPWPQDFVDPNWDLRERRRVIEYVTDERFRGHSYFGTSTCRICQRSNGSADFYDEAFVWPEGYGHYLAEHLVRPPEHFVRHVLSKSRF